MKKCNREIASLETSKLDSHLLPLDHVRLLRACCVQTLGVLEHDEGKATGTSGVGVGLQVDVVDLAVLAEVLLDVEVLRLLRETAHKELPIILTDGGNSGGLGLLLCSCDLLLLLGNLLVGHLVLSLSQVGQNTKMAANARQL